MLNNAFSNKYSLIDIYNYTIVCFPYNNKINAETKQAFYVPK